VNGGSDWMSKRLEDDEAAAFRRQVFAEHRQKEAELLAAAKDRAVERGKEAFDLDRFEEIYTIGKETGGTREERLAAREYDYYVMFEATMTMQEYAKRVWEVNDFWDGRR
jgi:hypothetical protein